MSQQLQTFDLSTDEFKPVKKVNTGTVNSELRTKGTYNQCYSSTCISHWLRFNKEELFGFSKAANGTIEIDLEASEKTIQLTSSVKINDQVGIDVNIRADINEDNYTPIITFDLFYNNDAEIDKDGTVQVIAKLYESMSKEISSRQKFNLTLTKQQKIFESKREFDKSEANEFVLEMYIDAGGFIKEKGLPNGIVNLGVTCYMNSYIQTIFHLKKFRYYINQLKTEDSNDFIFCLQSLFYSLEKGDVEAHTLDLVKAFGWNLEQMFMQQDVQEFSLKLLDAIEERSKRQGVKHIVTKELFRGKLESYIKCVNVEFESRKQEDFYELQLNIKETSELSGALNQLLQQETLFGDNAYDTEKMGKQDAIKGIRLVRLPDVLVFNVNRSDYNLETFEPVKLLNEFRFGEEIDMAAYSEDGGIYSLFGVFVHIGFDSGRGHYTVFLKPNDQWYEFNDEIVTKTDWESVSKQSYGGKNRETVFDIKTYELKERLKDSPSHAYMLVYVKKDELDQVVNNCNRIVPYPEEVVDYTEKKLKQMRKKRMRDETYKVYFTTSESFIDRLTGLGELFYMLYNKDPFDIERFKQGPFEKENLNRDIRANELLNIIEDNYGKNALVYVLNHKRKHLRLVKPNHTQPQFDSNLYYQYTFIYKIKPEELNMSNPTLLILKHYNPETNQLVVKSISLEDINATLSSIIQRLTDTDPSGVAVFYEPNFQRVQLVHQEVLETQLSELFTSRVKSEDVIVLVYTSKTEEAIKGLSDLWESFKDNVFIRLWIEPDRSEDHVFNMFEPANALLDYLQSRNLIDNASNYNVSAIMNNNSFVIDYEKLTDFKIGNLICDDNNLSINKIEHHDVELYCNVQIYNFKIKKYTTIERTAEIQINAKIELDAQYLNNSLRRNQIVDETLSDNRDYFNMRYRRYNVQKYKQIVRLITGEIIEWTDITLFPDQIDVVYIVPLIVIEHQHNGNGNEIQIKSNHNGHANGCCGDTTVNINLHINKVEEAGQVIVGFSAQQKITFEELNEVISRFIKKTLIPFEEESDIKLESDEDFQNGFIIRFKDIDGIVKGINEFKGHKVGAQMLDHNLDLYLIGVKPANKTLEIELSP